VVSTQTIDHSPVGPADDETFDIGSKTGTSIDDNDYQVPFAFTGKIDKLRITVTWPELTEEDKTRLMESERSTGCELTVLCERSSCRNRCTANALRSRLSSM
jgi:arylsulfatase